MSLVARRNRSLEPVPQGDGVGVDALDDYDIRPSRSFARSFTPDLAGEDDRSAEFATSDEELYAGTPFVGKVFRVRDTPVGPQRRFVCAYPPEEPGTLDQFVRSGPGGRREGGEYRLRTTVTGHEQEIRFFIDGAEDAPEPAPRARQALSPEQEEAIEERIRLEERAAARRKYSRELEDTERELANAKHDRDAAERKARDLADQYDQLRARLREAEAAAAEARAEAAEARARLVREHAEELSRAERKQFQEVERLRREIAELRQECALLELRNELGGGGSRDTIDRVLDFVSRFELPEHVMEMLAERFAAAPAEAVHQAAVQVYAAPESGRQPLSGPPAYAQPDVYAQPYPAPGHAFPAQGFAPEAAAFPPPPRPVAPAEAPARAEERGDSPSSTAPDAPADDPAVQMLTEVTQHALAALRRTVDVPPDQFAAWLDGQRARAEALGLDLGEAAGPLLVGLATEAAAAAVEPERVAAYLAPTIDRLAPQARRFLKGPSSFLAQALCQMVEVSLPPEQMRYLADVLDAVKSRRAEPVAA